MKIAVPCEGSLICPHLSDAKEFLLYDVMDDEILSREAVPFDADGNAASLVDFLKENKTALLICGSVPVSVVIALQQTNIQLLGGAGGNADDRVNDFLGGTLHFDRSGSCASCSSACNLQGKMSDGHEPECDGNISACGHWCH